MERRAVDPHDLDAAAGRDIGPGDPPHGVVDRYRARAIHDRLFQREDAAHEGLGAAIEERLVGRLADLHREPTPQWDRGNGEYRESDELRLPGPVHEYRDRADQHRGEAEPQHEYAGRQNLKNEQQSAGDEPVPESERGE